jgi:hypothetical protein
LLHTTIAQVASPEPYQQFIPVLLQLLRNINDNAKDYYYYMTPCPWLQVKIFQIL